ncbi:chemotaxis protein CheW [Limnobacter parvus]|uniref:Chemotaxis protein CheW n=1 Tax=Limnobacter parvus TaxID=2939690 RepID=A0ABT1XJR2_9BURK|nr:chemotaxis protein CheW [Limnobacter parvus]MCR2747536.1 chemotaxis protein CheW [Limnobacter parvus]
MASRKYRGIEIDVAHIDMAKNIDSVHELIDELRDLQSTWNSLSLLGELTQVGTEISDTRQHFQQLACDLTNFLVEQSTHQAIELLSTRAQNSIDILIRNLYERTADIGFLATDPVFSQCCDDHQNTPLTDTAAHEVTRRMRDYVTNYSVYKNVILMDAQAKVIADMQGKLTAGTSLEWLKAQVLGSANYVEAYRPVQEDPTDLKDELIYAWKIGLAGQIKGYIALVFNLEQESEALFSKVVGRRNAASQPEWRVCGVSDTQGKVLVSSNPQYIAPNQTICLPENSDWGLAQIGPMAYLCCVRSTRGYQGYAGPGWKGFCLVPLSHAFNTNHSNTNRLPEIDKKDGLIDHRILKIQDQAEQIQRQLNRSVWNGNMNQREVKTDLGGSFSKTLLWEISRTGERTKTLFTNSLHDLVQTEINGFQIEQQARAMLAIDLMDRNLYERANDCRWWALNPTLRDALVQINDTAARARAMDCLKHIHSLYTVYTNILLLDRTGHVMCDSAQLTEPGTYIEAAWARQVIQLKDQTQYCVSEFESTPLYQDRPTYIYAAAIFEDPSHPTEVTGAIALVFDSEPQFEAILNESMGDSKHKAFAFFVDEQNRIVSSTTDQFCENGRLNLPVKRRLPFEKQGNELGYFTHENRLIAYGSCNSGAYREYKSDSSAYQNNLICVYGLNIGALAKNRNKPIEMNFDEFRQTGLKEQMVDVASFRLGQSWYGLDSEDAVEAFLCDQIARMPNTPNWIVGTTLHKNESVTLVNLEQVLESKPCPVLGLKTRKQMILLKTGKHRARIALAVDDLGEIPSLPMSAIQESAGLNTKCSIVQGLIQTGSGIVVMLNIEQLLNQLEAGIKKAPNTGQGLLQKVLRRVD